MSEQTRTNTQLSIEEVKYGTTFLRLLKLQNRFIFLRKKSKDIFSMNEFL